MAAGRPVVAFGRGGATETVVAPGGDTAPTGVFFHESTEESLIEALENLERRLELFAPKLLRERSMEFDLSVFEGQLRRVLVEEGIG